jgi:hypothetical protein
VTDDFLGEDKVRVLTTVARGRRGAFIEYVDIEIVEYVRDNNIHIREALPFGETGNVFIGLDAWSFAGHVDTDVVTFEPHCYIDAGQDNPQEAEERSSGRTSSFSTRVDRNEWASSVTRFHWWFFRSGTVIRFVGWRSRHWGRCTIVVLRWTGTGRVVRIVVGSIGGVRFIGARLVRSIVTTNWKTDAGWSRSGIIRAVGAGRGFFVGRGGVVMIGRSVVVVWEGIVIPRRRSVGGVIVSGFFKFAPGGDESSMSSRVLKLFETKY